MDKDKISSLIERYKEIGYIPEDVSKNILKDYGLNVPGAGVAKSPEDAVDIASKIGYPVVMKILSPEIYHKTDMGGIITDITSEKDLKDAFTQIMENTKAYKPDATIDGVYIEQMAPKGEEIIIGLVSDPKLTPFGPTIMFGLGGIFTEIFDDVTFRVLPITKEDALEMVEEIKGKLLLEGIRGRDKISKDKLADYLMKIGELGWAFREYLDTADFNPIRVTKDEFLVLDAKIFLRKEKLEIVDELKGNDTYIDTLFNPNVVAVVGASSTKGKLGQVVMENLLEYEWQGKVIPINPGREEVMGEKAYPSILDVPEKIDGVVITVDLKFVPEILEQCAKKDIHTMVVLSGGGKELGGERERIEKEISRLAKEYTIRIIGPNCIGISASHNRFDTFFQSHERMLRPKFGPIAILAQSGTYGASLGEQLDNVGISYLVSYGNRVDIDEADLIEFLGKDDNTNVIAIYVEGLKELEGRKFLNVAKRVAKKKPIVFFKSGKTKEASLGVTSHTGALAGVYKIYKGAFKQAGVILAGSYEELLAAVKAIAMQPKAKGNRFGMVSNGAGTMVSGFDHLEQYDLELPDVSESTMKSMKEVFPPFFVLYKSIIDVTGSANSEHYRIGMEHLINDENVDIIMPWFVFQDTPLDENIVNVLDELNRKTDKPIICGAIGGPYTEKMAKRIEEIGVPVFLSVTQWMFAASALSKI